MAIGLSQFGGYGQCNDEYAREQAYRNEMMARQMMGLGYPQQAQSLKEVETKPDVKLLLLGD